MKAKQSIWRRNLADNIYFRRAHIKLLATPNYRRTQTVHPRDTPSRSMVEPIWPVPLAARRSSHSPRVGKLAVSKQKMREEYAHARNPPVVQNALGVFPHGGYLQKKSGLRGKATNRTKMLATPKLTTLVNNLTDYRKRLGRNYTRRMSQRITTALRHNYTTLYVRPSNVLQVNVPETKSEASISSKEDWKRHRLWLSQRASARVIPSQPLPPRKTRPLEQLLVRLEEMSRPSERHMRRNDSRPNVPVIVDSYKPTPRTLEMAKPKKYDVEKGPIRTFMGVTKGALDYEPSKRIKEIAEPRPRSNFVDPDMKEDPYKINPFALTYVCSPRMTQLAKPRAVVQ